MKAEVQVTIKTKKGNVILNSEEAKELYYELKRFYEKDKEYIPYHPWGWYPKEWWQQPYTYEYIPAIKWQTTCKNVEVVYRNNEIVYNNPLKTEVIR